MNNQHKAILQIMRTVFFAMFLYSAYRKLNQALSVSHKVVEKKSFKIIPEKGILGTIKEIMKASR